ncbi:uncharacterized protein [Hetaerina americana]|uniref:uncharacterized protein n=1 Tax=Hetaerina americana TaxID=62018 RepID=UPI003A7F1C23
MKVRETTALFTILITASLIHQTPGAEEPDGELVWIEGDSQVVLDSGSLLELTCYVKITTPANVLWVKVNDDGSELIAHDERLLIENERISVNHSSSEGMSQLKIENTNSKDSGRYECQVPMMNSTINAAVEVLVRMNTDDTNSSTEDSLPTNTSLPDGGTTNPSKGHSVTYSVFVTSSFVVLCVLFNSIPVVMQC